MENLTCIEQPEIPARYRQPDNPAVTLADILRHKEERAALQRELLRSGPGVLLGLLVNIPGPVKQSEASRTIHRAGQADVRQQLEAAGWPGYTEQAFDLCTGPESLFQVQADAQALKALAVAIEEQHPLGRLFDLDVISHNGQPVSREDLGLPQRRCLLCGEDAAICSRSRRHTTSELWARISQMLVEWEHDHGNG